MIKKILLGVVVLGVIAVALMGYGTYKVTDDFLKEKEPQLRQYIQLDETAQNKYVLEHVGELLSAMKIDLDKDGKPEDKESLEKLMKANAQPEIQNALAEAGRSVMATAIMMSEPIVKDLSADVKAKYEKESEQMEARFDKYSKLVEAAEGKPAK